MRLLIVTALLAQSATEQEQIRRGMELRDAGDGAGAVAAFREAVARNPKLPKIHREIGLLLLDRRDFAGAAEAFRQAWTLDPADLDSRYNHAVALANAGSREEAVALLEKLAAHRPGFALTYFGLGHVRAAMGEATAAETNYRKAVQRDPALVRGWFELGRLLERKGDPAGAANCYRAAIARKADFSAAHYRLASLLRNSGDEAGARVEMEQVRKLAARRAGGERAAQAYLSAMSLLDRGRPAEAVRALEEARAVRPDFEEIASALAAAYVAWAVEAERAGDVGEAVARFSKALALEPDPETENHVGVLLARSGRMAEAIERFRAALAVRPGYSSARQNLDRALAIAK